jgi:hypothetical protein
MTKPLSSTLPRWASTVTADPARVVNPPSGKKDVGFDVAEKPPAQWLNWLLYNAYAWLLWLDSFESEPHTWTRTQTFGEGISCSNTLLNTRAVYAIGNGTAEGLYGVGGSGGGHGVVGAGSGAGTYGVRGIGVATGVIGVRGEGFDSFGGSFLGGANYAGAFGTGGAGGAPGLAGQGTGAFAGVVGQGGPTGRGAEFAGGAGGSPCGARCVGGGTDGHGVEAVGTGTGFAVEATGSIHTDFHVYADQSVVVGITPNVGALYSSYVEHVLPAHPAAGASIKGRVAPSNTARVLATITTDGAGNLTVVDDQGVSGAAIVGGHKIQINFVDPFAVTGSYQAVVSGYDSGTGGGDFTVQQTDKAAAYVRVRCPSNPTTNVMNLDVIVVGRQ